IRIDFTCADAHGALDIEDKDLAVADLPGMRGLRDCFDHLIGHVGGNHDFDLYFGQEADVVLGTTVDFRLSLLAPETFDLGNREPLHAQRRERLAHVVELERLDDGHDQFHCLTSCVVECRIASLHAVGERCPADHGDAGFNNRANPGTDGLPASWRDDANSSGTICTLTRHLPN